MASRTKTSRVEDLVEAIDAITGDPEDVKSQATIRDGLLHKHWMPVEHAARLVAQHSLAGFTQELLGVWRRFVDPGAKLDPGCHAKEAALIALDALEWFDPDPFLVAIRYHQPEPSHGGAIDTAGGVRQRALFALLRQHHSQAHLYAGELLADPLVEVRVGAADALCQYAGPNGAGLLVQRLHAGDDSRVLLACASGLLELEAAFARDLLGSWLTHNDEERREVAAVALGQCKSAEAGELLIRWFDDLAWDKDFDLGARALALHRGERTRGCLLDHIAHGSAARASAVIRALSVHRYDVRLMDRIREAAQGNPDSKVADLAESALRTSAA